ncbi:hypothetical protein G6011_03496 [Alternaria panax]|uniref:Uncharacterized protein n=1 Tax=Alternaria panax TaxID=48097 RepID=A0AAD4NR55_9PLEO|nr:hypothetical protein G6011_03496 [Alternaria panax]
MNRDSDQGTSYIDPLNTHWDSDIEEEMVSWGWGNWVEEDSWCYSSEQGLMPALTVLAISDTYTGYGGEHICWSAFHYDGPGVIFDPDGPEYIDDKDDMMLAKDI